MMGQLGQPWRTWRSWRKSACILIHFEDITDHDDTVMHTIWYVLIWWDDSNVVQTSSPLDPPLLPSCIHYKHLYKSSMPCLALLREGSLTIHVPHLTASAAKSHLDVSLTSWVHWTCGRQPRRWHLQQCDLEEKIRRVDHPKLSHKLKDCRL